MSQKYNDTLLGVKISRALAYSEARSFFRIENGVLKQLHAPDYDNALKLTQPALGVFKNQTDKSLNITYHNLVTSRANVMVTQGKYKDAIHELSELHKEFDYPWSQ